MSTPILFYYHNTPTLAYQILSNLLKKYRHQVTSQYDEFKIDVYALLDSPKSNIIALDWDNTITADVEFYRHLIDSYKECDITPIICTLRKQTKENIREIYNTLQRDDIQIYGTNGASKQNYLRALNIDINLWLDDFYPAICRYGCSLLKENGIDDDEY